MVSQKDTCGCLRRHTGSPGRGKEVPLTSLFMGVSSLGSVRSDRRTHSGTAGVFIPRPRTQGHRGPYDGNNPLEMTFTLFCGPIFCSTFSVFLGAKEMLAVM